MAVCVCAFLVVGWPPRLLQEFSADDSIRRTAKTSNVNKGRPFNIATLASAFSLLAAIFRPPGGSAGLLKSLDIINGTTVSILTQVVSSDRSAKPRDWQLHDSPSQSARGVSLLFSAEKQTRIKSSVTISPERDIRQLDRYPIAHKWHLTDRSADSRLLLKDTDAAAEWQLERRA